LALLAALVLLGLVPWPGVTVTLRSARRTVFAAAFLGLAVYLGVGTLGRPLDGYTEAYLPPDLSTRPAARTAGTKADLLGPEALAQLRWSDSLKEGLQRAKATGKPVFVDFTGYTCVNCRWMEKNVFVERRVYEALRDRFVLVQLYTDGGPNGDANQQLQIDRFRTIALPFYVVLGPDDSLLAKQAGISQSPAEFLVFLNAAAQPRAGASKRS